MDNEKLNMDNEKLNIAKIACALGTESQGRIQSRGGYFGAMNLVADVQYKFKKIFLYLSNNKLQDWKQK